MRELSCDVRCGREDERALEVGSIVIGRRVNVGSIFFFFWWGGKRGVFVRSYPLRGRFPGCFPDYSLVQGMRVSVVKFPSEPWKEIAVTKIRCLNGEIFDSLSVYKTQWRVIETKIAEKT